MANRKAAAKKADTWTRTLRAAGKRTATTRRLRTAGVLIRFIIRLGDVNFGGGPLFHRWLPNGIQDSIQPQVEIGHLQLWFEKRGYTNNGMVQFSFKRHEVDDKIVAKQGRLDAGPLFGMLKLNDVTRTLMTALRRDSIGDSKYVALGKSIIKSVYPVVERLVKHLRVRFGQHWLTPPEKWDSRYRSLGAVCDDWNMSWSDDNGQTWHRFKPDKSVRNYGPLARTPFSEYMIQSDWAALKAMVERGDDPPLAAELVTNSHRLVSQTELRHGLVEACSALEVAISAAVRAPIKASKVLTNSIGSFLTDIPLKARMVVVASLAGGTQNSILEEALAAADLRNKVVHEGFIPDSRDIGRIRAVLDVATRLVAEPRLKFPIQSGSNFIAEPQAWERSRGYDPVVVGGVSIADA